MPTPICMPPSAPRSWRFSSGRGRTHRYGRWRAVIAATVATCLNNQATSCNGPSNPSWAARTAHAPGLQHRTTDEDGLPSQFTITDGAADRPYQQLYSAPVKNPVGLVHGDLRLVPIQGAFEDARYHRCEHHAADRPQQSN